MGRGSVSLAGERVLKVWAMCSDRKSPVFISDLAQLLRELLGIDVRIFHHHF